MLPKTFCQGPVPKGEYYPYERCGVKIEDFGVLVSGIVTSAEGDLGAHLT